MGLFGSIRSRVLFGTLALTLIPLLIAAAVIGFQSYQSARTSLRDRAFAQLESVRFVQSQQVKAYFESLQETLRVIAANPGLKQEFKDLRDAFPTVKETVTASIDEQRTALKDYFGGAFAIEYKNRNGAQPIDMGAVVDTLPPETLALQYLYIAKNDNKLGDKFQLEQADSASIYNAEHAELHRWVRTVINQYKLYDFFLVDMNGNVIYSYFKEADFATSLTDGPYAGSSLGDAFVAARDSDDAELVTLTDYQKYLPSFDDQASFLSVPIVENKQTIGVFVVQVPIDEVNNLLTFGANWEGSGLGKTGETLLVGTDRTTRSISRGVRTDKAAFVAANKASLGIGVGDSILARGSDVGALEVNSLGVDEAMKGTTGSREYVNHLKKSVLGAFTQIDVVGQKWNLLAEVEQSEAFEPVGALLRKIGLASLITAGILGLIGFLFSSRLAKSINVPISQLQNTVQEITAGNLEARTKMQPTDELGQLGSAFDNLLDERVSSLVQQAHENEVLNNSVIEIMQSLGQLAQNDLTVKIPVTGDVTGAISDAINLVTTETGTALKQVLNISSNVARASTMVRQRAQEVSAAAEKSGVEVSSASRELEGAAIALSQIATQANSANDAAERAISATSQALKIVSDTVQGVSASRDQIRETEKRLKRLGERSQEITTVVNIINQIAERTSVLALNAGMQAAAAGEAGRGFALVADEVKRLAESARDATRQIGTLVTGIQADSGDTIRTMNETITQVVEISKLAERAGEQMERTLAATDGLVGSVREIANTTSQQARASDTLLQRARNIETTNRETLEQLSAQREETARLMQYSKALVDTVRVFKLPGVDSSSQS